MQTRYSCTDGSSQTLCFSISTKKNLNDDDAETFRVALRFLQHETVNLVEFLKIRTGCTQYYFEYSSDDYIKAYERFEGSGEDKIEAEFGIALEITSGCATKMHIRTTDNDVTAPLYSDQAIEPLDRQAITAYVTTALNHGTNPSTAASHAAMLLALSRFGRENQTLDQPFSLPMLADPQRQEAADTWVQMFRDAPGTTSAYRAKLTGAVKAFRTGYVPAREEDDPLDKQVVIVYMITALNHGTNPSTVGSHATLLLALSRFGRKNQTPDQPFSLPMLADPQRQEEADSWVRMFRGAPDIGPTYRKHIAAAVQALLTGHAPARKEDDPLDRRAIIVYVTTALNHGTNPSTAGSHAALLLALSRFGHKNQTLDQPFSLPMLADPQRQEAADIWVQRFRDAPDTTSAYRERLTGAVNAFRTGYVPARKEYDPLDKQAIIVYMITALNHGTNPSTAGSHATVLLALSRFGRKNQTLEQPFSVPMLADPQRREAADTWVQMFRGAPDTTSAYRENVTGAVKAFRTGHVPTREEDNSLDKQVVIVYIITALNHGTNPSTVGSHTTLLLALSRFGRKNQTPDQPFSLPMLADPQRQESADTWVQMFRDAPATTETDRKHIAAAVKALRAQHAQAGQIPTLKVLPIR